MKKIAFVASHGGSYKTLLPIAALLLVRDDIDVHWFSDHGSAATGKMDKQSVEYSHWHPREVDWKIYDAVVTGVSGLGEVNADFIAAKEAKEAGVPVVKVIDFWGTGMPQEKGFAPDRLCVLDEPSVAYEARMRNMDSALIRVTGDPKMDNLTEVETSDGAKKLNRRILGVDTEYFFVFSGPSSQERVMEVLPALAEAIQGGLVDWMADEGSYCEAYPTSVTLGTLWHPGHSKDSKQVEKCYEILDRFGVVYVRDDELRSKMNNNDIYVASDLVIGATSTETVASCYLRRQTLNIIYPGGINYRDILQPREISMIPTVECGAALLAEDPADVLRKINMIYGEEKPAMYRYDTKFSVGPDDLSQKDAQERYYSLDGKNTERVVNVIKEVL